MQRISIADYFKKELNIKHNTLKLKELQKLNRESYQIKLEQLHNARETMFLYYEGDKGLIAFLEDYLELFDPNVASAQDTIIVIDGKIRDLINEGTGEVKQVKEEKEIKAAKSSRKPRVEEKYTVAEISAMFSEFSKLDEAYGPRAVEIERWMKLKEIFKK